MQRISYELPATKTYFNYVLIIPYDMYCFHSMKRTIESLFVVLILCQERMQSHLCLKRDAKCKIVCKKN